MSARMDRIIAEVESHPHAFDFDRDGFGEELAELTASCIFAYMDAGIDPDNNPWIDLEPGYERWKAAHHPGRSIGELDLIMKDPEQLRGEPAISAGAMTQEYGTDDVARLHAEWFQEGDEEQNRPPRRFYDFNDLAVAELGDRCDRRFDDAIT